MTKGQTKKRKRKKVGREVMDRTHKNCCTLSIENSDFPVCCTEEVLLSFFTDESLPVTMDAQQPPAFHSVPAALPELRLVLLGRKGAGKSAAVNSILGGVGSFESGKPTEECVKRKADVAGRRVTVVDTPGWEWYYPLNNTPNWVRRETLRSVSLFPSGPHVVLLVVRSCASVTEDYIREIEEHLEPLGKRVWEHTMLLFTRGDELGLTSMEQRILTSGPTLQGLLQKCGNRYHVVDNRSKGDASQVKELIRKLAEMVEGQRCGSSYLEVDNTVLLGLEADRKRRAREVRKKQRQMEEQIQRATIKAALMSDDLQGSELDAHQSFSKAPRRLPEVRLLLLGERETGKSSAGNAILGKTGLFQVGVVTEECIRQQAEVAMRLVTVVDSPGWEGGVAGGTPERVKREIASSIALCPPGPHALLLALRVDTLVVAGHVREHLELLGKGVWRHTILLFTHADQLREGVNMEQHIQGGGRDLQWLLEKCRGRYHVISGLDGEGRGSTVPELLQKVEKMSATNRCEAFSGLVHDVRDLSRQKNEKFSQRLKDMGDRMLRQEAELKKLREREMKSIRWFFDRKKKVKSPGNTDVQREEEEDEDRRADEKRNDIGELEERIQWLTEDKEREIQDLSIEKERLHVALNQSRRDREEAVLNLELKEREIEELKERIEEQQMKMLDLERAGAENEHERKQREDAFDLRKQEWISEVEKLDEIIDLQMEEQAEWKDKVESLKTEMEETKRHYDDLLMSKAQERNREMAEIEERLKAEMEIKLREKDHQQEELRKTVSEEKQKALDQVKQYEKQMESRVEEMKSQHKKEIERKTEEREAEMQSIQLQHQQEMGRKISELEQMMEAMKAQHQKDVDQKLRDNAGEKERIKTQHASEKRDLEREKEREIVQLKGQFAKETEEQMQAKKREMAELEQRYLAQIEGKMLESKEEMEMIHLNLRRDMAQKMHEKEKEIEAFKLQHQEEVEKLTEARRAEHQQEMDRKMKEMEKEVEKKQQEFIDKIRDVEQARQREIKEVRQQLAQENEKRLQERQELMRELEQKYATQLQEKLKENEKEKQIMNQNHEKDTLQKQHERDRIVDELRLKHVSEIQERTHESDREKERLVMNLKNEAQQKLGEKEMQVEELKLRLKQRESDHLLATKETEQRLENEREAIKERLKEVQQRLRQAEEERERDSLKYKEQMQQKLEEKDRLIESLNQHIEDVDEILRRREEERGEIILGQKKEAEQRLLDREREMEEMKLGLLNDTERKLEEKETEIRSLKQQAECREVRWREEQRRREERAENETNRLIEIIDKKAKEIAEAQCLLAARDSEIDEAKTIYANYMKELEEQQEISEKQIIQIQRHHVELERKKDAEVMEKFQEKEEELHRLRQRDGESEKELAHLRLTIEQTKAELKDLTSKMEKEMTSMIREYEKEIARRNESIESITKERDRLEGESRQNVSEVREKYEESRRKAEELQEQNKKLHEEGDDLKTECDELRREIEEIRKHLEGHEQQVQDRDAEKQERDGEVTLLKEANDKLQVEIEKMMEEVGEAERQMNEMREKLLTQLKEKECVFRVKEQEIEEEFSKREQVLSQRGHELDAKEEELVEKEASLQNKMCELSEREAGLERQQKEQEDKYKQEESRRAQHLAEKEQELEKLLRDLEGKQKELNCHGQDLQKKVKGLKDQGKELKDRACYLRNEEQELLNWKSELQMQNEHVNSTTQQLDEIGRELALLKDELHHKEKKLKESFKKLSKWEQNLKEREDELLERERSHLEDRRDEVDDQGRVQERDSFDLTAAVETPQDNLHLGYQATQGEEEEGRGSDRGEHAKESKDQRMKAVLSAPETNNHHPETLKVIRTAEVKEGVLEMETSLTKDRELTRNFHCFPPQRGHRTSNNKEPPGSALRVMVLGESWSSRSPAGLTILCGEAAKHSGSTFRHWTGQVAGRRLTVAEPLGLRWRDGPSPADTVQRRGILDSISWCHPGPHVVLLLMPAFLTCTQKFRRAVEEHMRLLGEDIWQHALVLFTWGEILGESIEQHIQRNGELMGLVERCSGRYHVLTSQKSNSLAEGLFDVIETLTRC